MDLSTVSLSHERAEDLHSRNFGDEGIVVDLGCARGDASAIESEPI